MSTEDNGWKPVCKCAELKAELDALRELVEHTHLGGPTSFDKEDRLVPTDIYPTQPSYGEMAHPMAHQPPLWKLRFDTKRKAQP